jgi:hypothetical protein
MASLLCGMICLAAPTMCGGPNAPAAAVSQWRSRKDHSFLAWWHSLPAIRIASAKPGELQHDLRRCRARSGRRARPSSPWVR